MHISMMDPKKGGMGITTTAETTDEARISITREECERRSSMGGGPTVAMIEITEGEGKTARFWICAEVHNGRPSLRVTAHKGAKDTHRDSPGSWVDFRRRDSNGKPIND